MNFFNLQTQAKMDFTITNANVIRCYLRKYKINISDFYLNKLMLRYSHFSSLYLVTVMLRDHEIDTYGLEGTLEEIQNSFGYFLTQNTKQELVILGSKSEAMGVPTLRPQQNLFSSQNLVAISINTDRTLPPALSSENCKFKELVLYKLSNGESYQLSHVEFAKCPKLKKRGDYFYNDTKILRNKLGLRNQKLIEERSCVEAKRGERNINPFAQSEASLEKLCSIHKSLFGTIFDWAGHLRTCNIQKLGNSFVDYRFLVAIYEEIFHDFRTLPDLSAMNVNEQVKVLSLLYSNLITVHGFREGNGRLVRSFINGLAHSLQLKISFERISKEKLFNASRRANYGMPETIISLFSLNISRY
jgi:cell filamentation protein